MQAKADASEARWSRQRVAQTGQAVESGPEVDGTTYMPGVYKMLMGATRSLVKS